MGTFSQSPFFLNILEYPASLEAGFFTFYYLNAVSVYEHETNQE
jgi:hypothetical protein